MTVPWQEASKILGRQEVRAAGGLPLAGIVAGASQLMGGKKKDGGSVPIGSILGSALPALGKLGAGNGSALGVLSSIAGPLLPPGVAPFLGIGQSFLTKGLTSLMGGGAESCAAGVDDISAFASGCFGGPAGDAVGLAGQFDGLLEQMGGLESLVGQFLPPELQGVWSAVQAAGGLKGLRDMALGAPEGDDSTKQPDKGSGSGLPAARVGDPHKCSLADPKPHAGGPILPTGCPTVLIGGSPAARITDKAFCVGPPDMISAGEPTVLIGALAAARETDPTLHGGSIVKGLPSVWIGKARAKSLDLTARKCAESSHESGVAGTV